MHHETNEESILALIKSLSCCLLHRKRRPKSTNRYQAAESGAVHHPSSRARDKPSYVDIYEALLKPGQGHSGEADGENLRYSLMSHVDRLGLTDEETKRLNEKIADVSTLPAGEDILKFLVAVASDNQAETTRNKPVNLDERIFGCPVSMLDGSAFEQDTRYIHQMDQEMSLFDAPPGSYLKLSSNFFHLYGIPVETSTQPKTQNVDSPESPDEDMPSLDDWLEAVKMGPLPPHRTWESLGFIVPEKQPPLLSEIRNPPPELLRDATPISLQDIRRELSYLLVGVPSITFPYAQEKGSFEFAEDLVIAGLSRQACIELLRPLMEYGNKQLWLDKFTKIPNDDFGPLFKALQQNVSRFLVLQRESTQRLLSRAGVGPLQLNNSVSDLAPALNMVAAVCSGLDPKSGVDILERLSKQAEVMPLGRSTFVLYSLLKQVLEAYFRILSQWLFDGKIDPEGATDFFVVAHPTKLSLRTRKFWIEGYTICVERIPRFLQGLEEPLLLCGKAVGLLKLCNIKDPLISNLIEERPGLECCLQPSELSELHQKWESFGERARQASGEPVTASSQLERSKEQEQAFLEMVGKIQKQRLIEIRESQRREREERWQARQQLQAELRQQMREAQERKAELQRQEQEEEEERQKFLEVQNALLDLKMAEERDKMLRHYEELSRASERRLEHAERKIERLRHELDDVPAEAEEDVVDHVTADLNKNSPQAPQLVKDDNANPRKPPTTLPLRASHQADLILQTNKLNKAADTVDTVGLDSQPVQVPTIFTDTVESYKATVAEAAKNKARVLTQEMNFNFQDTTEKNKNDNESRVKASGENLNQISPILMSLSNKSNNPAFSEAAKNKARAQVHEWGIHKVPDNKLLRKLSTQRSEEPSTRNDNSPGSESLNSLLTPSSCEGLLQSDSEKVVDSSSARQSLMAISIDSARSLKTDLETPTGTNPSAMSISMDTSSCDNLLSPDSVTTSSVLTESKVTFLETPTDLGPKKIPASTSNISFLSAFSALSEPLKYHASKDKESVRLNIKKLDLSLNHLGHLVRQTVAVALSTQLKLVNQSIMKLFLQDQQLLKHMNSLRQYFLLLDGEFARNMTKSLCEGMRDNHETPMGLLNFVSLDNILGHALSSSVYASKDPNAHRLSLTVKVTPSHFRLYDAAAVSCVQLQYQIDWPLCLILTPDALFQYDRVFIFLLGLRRGCWAVDEAFHWLQRPPTEGIDLKTLYRSPQYHKLRLLRHDMGNFTQAIHHYFINVGVLRQWEICKKFLIRASTLDDLYKSHIHFLKKVLLYCLLQDKAVDVQKLIQAAIQSLLKFQAKMVSCEWLLKDGVYEHPAFHELVTISGKFNYRVRGLLRFLTKLADRGYQPALFELLHSLNMNDYYNLSL